MSKLTCVCGESAYVFQEDLCFSCYAHALEQADYESALEVEEQIKLQKSELFYYRANLP